MIIYFNALKFFNKDSLSDKLYMSALYTTILMLGLDILSRFDGNSSIIYIVFNHAGNFLIFLLSPVLPSLWLAYVHYQVFCDERRTKRLFYPLCVINLINAVALIFSQFFGWYYYIDSENVYHRGTFFFFPVFITIMLMFAAFIIIIINHKNMGKRNFFFLAFFVIPPLISIIIQIKFSGILIILNSLVLSLLVLFLTLQNRSMYTDYLTGVSNRKKLDEYLNKKVSLSTDNKGFSAILLDMNNFKYINDTYGHDIGDKTLKAAAKLLKSCLRTSDFIARFGGDEFCIILDISNKSDLEAVVCRINNCLEKYNKSDSNPYKLEFSMGYAVYDCQLRKSAVEFLKQVDMLMYENKQAYKNKLNANLVIER